LTQNKCSTSTIICELLFYVKGWFVLYSELFRNAKRVRNNSAPRLGF
jgi:hypothetical protein